MIDLVLATPDVPGEPDLVAAAALHGIRVTRRSLDAADLLAAAAADPRMAVAVSLGVPRLSGDLVGRLTMDQRPFIGVAVGEVDEAQLRAWGVARIVRHGGDAAATMRAIAAHLQADADGQADADADERAGSGASPGGVWAMERELPGGSGQNAARSAGAGTRARAGNGNGDGDGDGDGDGNGNWNGADSRRLRRGGRGVVGARRSTAPVRAFVAVWGPTGAPGRTTTALCLAEAYARRGLRTCLVDADTYAPSVNAQLGVCEDASGLVIACRQADNATLSTRTMLAATRQFAENLFILGGLPRADRWPDLRESALYSVWRQAKDDFDVVIVDVGSCVEHEGAVANPAGSTLLASRRNAAAITAIEVADQVVVVARNSTIGVTRLLNELPSLMGVNDRASRVIVLTGPRRTARTEWGAKKLLRQIGISDSVVGLARDDGRLEQSLRRGVTPYESATRGERSVINAIATAINE